jgi:hypothetical protein
LVPFTAPAQSGHTVWKAQAGSTSGEQRRRHAPHASNSAPLCATPSQPAQLEPLPPHTPHASGRVA